MSKKSENMCASNANFARKLYGILSNDELAENLVFSPLSAHAVLSMLYGGAAGSTAEDFERSLELDGKKNTAEEYGGVIEKLNGVENVALNVANKIFVANGFFLKEDFLVWCRESFSSETQQVNFGDNVASASCINGWVEEKTNEKIKNLILPTMLDGSTRLVLVNAVYFKGNWKKPFDKTLTTTKPFYVSEKNEVECQMMYLKSRFGYFEDQQLDAKILQLPYENGDITMLFILPNKVDGIKNLENKLQHFNLLELNRSLYKTEVKVHIPRFRIETTMNLNEPLSKIGLSSIFDPEKADFSDISSESLCVSKAIQKAFIEVNEEGAEAAAATAIIMVKCCAIISASETVFEANHPFIFVLQVRSEEKQHILFVGKVQNF